ncbi:MAG: single-stranded-DNA-specific exonuclease RecJ [Rickettsiales bacterium]|nr:single-stranded-DNA-specific exonuclease RecJ [Pseudomonadota bacterium]MDA0965930.1 single-stranded-DNA-specific exonuclease RecJ [Pseudomonadota bacterium]MDG4542600.1 single-stranded-DNA-specific exonuclease RecJ [Rickettsiales bacterium]MDG4545104.1 single-stranded-DNA-specific exonuclease RecJ [Rickettsiales bacterium]MDG4547227.1 single-stranded-DNA-specific exonuclease RecJ [Rickettsiales bacterium]
MLEAKGIVKETELREYHSVKGAVWKLRACDERQVLAISQKLEIPEILARMLYVRGVGLNEVESFLNPTLKFLMPDPFHLLDMEKAANRLADAVEKGEEIAVYGDYDVDGATSSSLLKRYFREIGNEPIIYIPDRIKEGYGPNTDALLYLKEHGVDVCVTVDCGTMSFEPLAAAKEAGLEVIVIDHHLSSETLPEAVAVVNPNRLDETSDQKHLAAVGVCFLLIVAVNKILRERGWFQKRKAPDLLNLLDIVALGTVCDVVPLKGVNRAFVSQGLKVMRNRHNCGLAALADIAKVDDCPSTYHLGFMMGPRINAGGRVGQSDLGARLLSTEDVDEAYDISMKLDNFNMERRAIESMVLESAVAQIEQKGTDRPVLFAIGEGWHPGVVGIVSSRITERFNRPSAIISINEGLGKASARSVSGIDFGSAIVAANQAGLLVTGGGHAMAAGFTVEEGKIDAMYEFLCKRFEENIDECAVKQIKADGFLSIDSATTELTDLIKKVEPFGTSNPEPRFIFNDLYIIYADIVGADHIKCVFGTDHAGNMGKTIKGMAFRSLETPLGKALLDNRGKTVSVAARVKLNSWRGVDTVELLIDDVAV